MSLTIRNTFLTRMTQTLRERGVAIIYVSHSTEELHELCDRVGVLRDGSLVGTYDLPATESSEIIRAMIGRALKTSLLGQSLDESHEKPRLGTGSASGTLLSVKGLQDKSMLRDINFDLRRGEVLGVAGLVGSGQTELATCLFGARERVAGRISLDGRTLKLDSPRDAIHNGIGLLPQDRKEQGFVHHMSVTHNITLASLRAFSRHTVLNKRNERRLAQDMIRKLTMRSVVPEKAVGTLSGGTQQKVVFAKWLVSNVRILLVDEPTRGIDVGAKEEIYELIAQFVRQGGSVMMFTSELPEVMMSDRVLVMARGRLVEAFHIQALLRRNHISCASEKDSRVRLPVSPHGPPFRDAHAERNESKGVRAIDAPEIVHPCLFPEFRRSGN
jgi:ribose transport system ATP-binding protein